MTARMTLTLTCAALAAISGCGAIEKNPFLSRHFSNEDKAAHSTKRWNDVRGNLKRQMAADQLKAGRVDEAQALLTESLALMPDDAEAYRLQTRICLLKGQLESAQLAAQESIRLEPESAEGHFLAGVVAERRSEPNQALEFFTNAIERNGDNEIYAVAKARTLVASGRDIEALRFVEDQCERLDRSVELRLLAMDLHRKVGNREAAGRFAMLVTHLAVDDCGAMVRAGEALSWAGADQEAVEVLAIYVAHLNENAADTTSVGRCEELPKELILRAFARSAAAIGEFEAAELALKPLLRNDPGDFISWSLFCRIAISARHYTEALSAAQTFNRRNGQNPDMMLLEGLVWFEKGERSKSAAIADAVLKIDPSCKAAIRLRERSANAIDAGSAPLTFFDRTRADEAQTALREDNDR